MMKKLTGILALTGILFHNVSMAQSAATAPTQGGGLMKTKPAEVGKDALYKLKRTKYAELRTWQYTFANGVKVVLRADDSQPDILLKAVSPGGASLLEDQDYYSALHAGNLISHGGLGDLSAAQVKTLLENRRVNIVPQITDRESILKGTFTRDEIETALQVIYLCFTQPDKNPAYFSSYIKNLKSGQVLKSRNPETVFQDSVSVALWGSRAAALNPEKISSISLDKAYQAFRRCFGNANGFTFIFTGNLKGDNMNEPTRLTPMLAQYLGALPSVGSPNTVTDKAPLIPQGKIIKNIDVPHGRQAEVRITYSGAYIHSDSVNLQLKVLASLMESKLNRLKVDAADTATVNLVLNKYPQPQYALTITYTCAPGQTAQSIARVKKLVADLQREVDPQEVKAFVEKRRKELKTDTFNYKWWLEYLAVQFVNGDDPYEIAHYPYNFHKATPESLKQAALQFLTPANYIQLTMVPR